MKKVNKKPESIEMPDNYRELNELLLKTLNDLANEKITPKEANRISNAAGKAIKKMADINKISTKLVTKDQ